jgi:G:T/U-mismatch repair DNA glycosylase
MIETHPFGSFIPPGAKYLPLGSFTGRQAVRGDAAFDEGYDWFYGTRRNQFWPILEAVYQTELKDKASKQALLADIRMAMADIILECERKAGNNLDANLVPITYNTATIQAILAQNPIERIYFSSRYVEKRFKQVFKQTIISNPHLGMITLPSPSRRYAVLSLQEKINRYKELLPH